jgi:hypothetical protein
MVTAAETRYHGSRLVARPMIHGRSAKPAYPISVG